MFNLVHSIIGGNASHTAFDKIASSLKLIVDEVLKVLSGGSGTNGGKKDAVKDRDQAFIREAVTDFFASLMDVANLYLVKRYK